MKEPLLTIAIPTYNRAEILGRTLDALFTNPDFDADKIEVMISDNASTDNTAEVMSRYPQVRYFRNEVNIGPNSNFTILLEHGRGKYLRLMNDTVRFNDGMLGKMLDRIEATDSTKENLYFANAVKPITKSDKDVVTGKDGFLGAISFFVTWIGNFGMWRVDFEKIDDKNRFVETLLHQVDWTLCMAGNGKKNRMVFDHFMHVEDVINKGSYDVFDVFVTKYFSILKFHRIGFFRMKMEKYRLFRFFIIQWVNDAGRHTLNTSNRGVIRRWYWYEPYYLLLFIYRIYRLCLKK